MFGLASARTRKHDPPFAHLAKPDVFRRNDMMIDGRSDATDAEVARPKPAGRWAWGVCWLLFASTTINYMDRQAVAVVGFQIQSEFQIRFVEFAWILAAFQLPYALFQVPAGMIADRGDVRRTYAIAAVMWSIAAMAVAYSPTLGALMMFRVALGVGESFNWPCALRVTAAVLRPADRGLGNGIFNSGAAVGAIVTPPLVGFLTLWFGWRSAFAMVGVAGLVWAIVWIWATYGPAKGWFVAPEDTSERTGGQPMSWRAVAIFGAIGGLAIGGGVVGFLYERLETLSLPEDVVAMISWRAAEGADVRRGDVIAAIEVGDANRVAVSRLDGRLTGKIARDGEMVAAGEPIGWVMVRPLGYSAFWLAIAGFMVGLLAAARLMPATWLGSGGWGQALGEVVRLRRFWVLAVVSISINVCWHFLVNWLPTYLLSDRGIDLKASLWLNALLFLAADAGNIGGGLASRKVAALGVEPGRARAIVVSACAVLIAGGAAVGLIENQAVVLVMLGVMAFGAAAFMANYFAFCQDVSPRRTGLVVGILGGLGNLFAAGFSPIAGGIKDATGGLAPVFWVVGLLPFLGVAVIWLGWRFGPARVVVAEPE